MLLMDTSALVRLIVREPESDPLRAALGAMNEVRLVASALVRTELRRAVLRWSVDDAELRAAATATAHDVLDGVDLLAMTPEVLDLAGRLDPPELRSLDAIHLATAVQLGAELDALVTYDARLAAAAPPEVPVLAPGS